MEKINAQRQAKPEFNSGPLLGADVSNNSKKPKLQGGLLGEMERRENELSELKKAGYRGSMMGQDRLAQGLDLLLPQLGAVAQKMMAQLSSPNVQSSAHLIDSMRADVSQMLLLIASYPKTLGNSRMSMADPHGENPFSMPNVNWVRSNTVPSSSGGNGTKLKLLGSNHSSTKDSRSYKTSSKESSSSLESDSDAYSGDSNPTDDDTPLKILVNPSKPSLSKAISSGTDSGSSEDSESSTEEVPLGNLAHVLQQPAASYQLQRPLSQFKQQVIPAPWTVEQPKLNPSLTTLVKGNVPIILKPGTDSSEGSVSD